MPASCHSDDWPWPTMSCIVLVGLDFATFDLGFYIASLPWYGHDRPLCLIVLLGRDLIGRSIHGLAQQGPGRPLRLAALLIRDLIDRSTSWSCSVRIWSVGSPHGLVWQGLGRSLRLVNLFSGDLVGLSTSRIYSIGRLWLARRVYGPYFG